MTKRNRKRFVNLGVIDDMAETALSLAESLEVSGEESTIKTEGTLSYQSTQNKGYQDSLTSVNRQRVGYEDTASTIFTENWDDLSAWTAPSTPGVQVSNNRLYATGTGGGGSGITHSYTLGVNDTLRAVFSVNVPSVPSSGGAVVGLSKDAAGAVPANGAANGFGLYFSSSGLVIMDSGSTAPLTEGTHTPSGDYLVTVMVDKMYISVSAVKSDGSFECAARKLRSSFTVNNLYLFNSDSRGLTGVSVGRGSARKGVQTISPRTFGEGLNKGIHWSGDGAQSWRVYAPSSYDSRIPYPLAICFHGNGTDETQWSINANMRSMQRALVDAGYIVLTCSLNSSKTTWGNASSTNAYYQAYKFVRDHYSIGPVVWYANSMGGIESLNALSENTIPCSAWIGTVPAYSLLNNYQNSAFTGVIRSAYGINADGSDYEAKTEGRDPALMSASAFRCVPMMILAPADDASISKTENTDKLAKAVEKISIELVKVDVPSGGHSFSIEPYKQQMIDFFKKYSG